MLSLTQNLHMTIINKIQQKHLIKVSISGKGKGKYIGDSVDDKFK